MLKFADSYDPDVSVKSRGYASGYCVGKLVLKGQPFRIVVGLRFEQQPRGVPPTHHIAMPGPVSELLGDVESGLVSEVLRDSVTTQNELEQQGSLRPPPSPAQARAWLR